MQKNSLESSNSNINHYEKRLQKHKLAIYYKWLLIVVVIGAVAGILVVFEQKKVYSGYEVVSSTEIELLNTMETIPLGDQVIVYSKDGASCLDSKGTVLWNQSYEMQRPIIKVCGDVVAIADYNGGDIYLLNTQKQLGTISVSLPIKNISVAENGVVAAVLEDAGITWIYYYDASGTELVKFKTTMENTGYPISVSLSNNALLCAVSYVYADVGRIKSSVAFYNFDEFGKNQVDNLVRGDECEDTIVSLVQFMDQEHAYAVGDDCIMFFSGSQIPEMKNKYFYSEPIVGVYHSSKYLGVVFRGKQKDSRYCLEIYNSNGEKVSTRDFNLEYENIFFEDNTYMIYNNKECIVANIDGRVKFEGAFEQDLLAVYPFKGNFRYLLVSQNMLEVVKMN